MTETILYRPALGYTAHLGELYDARNDKFLGVQMYAQEKIESVTSETNINHVDFQVKMSNSFHDKSELLDISAELSLSVLSGLVDIQGSGKYVHDTQSNSQARSWAMTLKAQLKEDRLRFAELSSEEVLSNVKENYLAKEKATHFVSGVTYGGNLIVSLTEKKSSSSDHEHISGSLEVTLDKLKGLVDLKGKAEVDIEGAKKEIEDTFDLKIYGDISVEGSLPTSADEIMEFLPDATSKFGEGVAISVTLQPIPKSIVDLAKLSHNIEKATLENILSTFAKLEDVKKRFEVLKERVNLHAELVPLLAKAVNEAISVFNPKLTGYFEKLREYVYELRSASVSGTYGTLLTDASELYATHVPTTNVSYEAPDYPTSLLGLEQALADFQDLFRSVVGPHCRLTTPKNVTDAITVERPIPIISLPPLGPNSVSVLIRNTHFVRTQSRLFSDTYVIYLESFDLKEAKELLPRAEVPRGLMEPRLFVVKLGRNAQLSWLAPPVAWTFDGLRTSEGDFAPKLIGIDGTSSFSIVFTADLAQSLSNLEIKMESPLVMLRMLNSSGDLESGFQLSLSWLKNVMVQSNNWKLEGADSTARWLFLGDYEFKYPLQEPFTVTFVQDISKKKRLLYYNATKQGEDDISNESLADPKLKQLRLVVGDAGNRVQPWRIHSVRAYAKAIVPPGGENENEA